MHFWSCRSLKICALKIVENFEWPLSASSVSILWWLLTRTSISLCIWVRSAFQFELCMPVAHQYHLVCVVASSTPIIASRTALSTAEYSINYSAPPMRHCRDVVTSSGIPSRRDDDVVESSHRDVMTIWHRHNIMQSHVSFLRIPKSPWSYEKHLRYTRDYIGKCRNGVESPWRHWEFPKVTENPRHCHDVIIMTLSSHRRHDLMSHSVSGNLEVIIMSWATSSFNSRLYQEI